MNAPEMLGKVNKLLYAAQTAPQNDNLMAIAILWSAFHLFASLGQGAAETD